MSDIVDSKCIMYRAYRIVEKFGDSAKTPFF